MTLPRLKLPWRWSNYGGLLCLICGREMILLPRVDEVQAARIARRHGALAE